MGGARAVIQSKIRASGTLSGTPGDKAFVTAESVFGGKAGDWWFDGGNWSDWIFTYNIALAQTVTAGGANITNATMNLVLNTVDSLDSWLNGGTTPNNTGSTKPGPCWIVSNLEVLKTAGVLSPQSNVWVKIVRSASTAVSTGAPFTSPVDRWLFWTVEVESGATAGTFECVFEITATMRNSS